jgi:hypothetical protein
MSTMNGTARAIASGGRGIAWLFLIPGTLVAIYTADSIMSWHGREPSLQQSAVNLAVIVVCVALWYFVIGRLPNRRFVNNVRHETPEAAQTFGADVFTRPGRSTRVTARFSGSVPNVLSVSRSGLQLWAGHGDTAGPVQTWRWKDIGPISAEGDGWSSLISIPTTDTLPLSFRLVENRWLAPLRVRGRARARVIAELEALRAGAEEA